jgi:hypothetical protein
MKKLIRRRPKAAMIVAIIALVAALGGTAVAGGGFLPKSKFSNFKKNTAVKGPITYVNQTQNVNTVTTTSGVNVTATCPGGFFPVGGGAKTSTPSSSTTSTFFVEASYPSANGWTALVFAGLNPAPGTPESVTVTAICERALTSGTPPTITP